MIFSSHKKQLKAIKEQWAKTKFGAFNFSFIQEYFDLKPSTATQSQINDRSVNDLDLHPFFEYIDRTRSAAGQQVLYANLRKLSPTKGNLDRQENWVQFYTHEVEKRWSAQQLLNQLNSPNDFPKSWRGKKSKR